VWKFSKGTVITSAFLVSKEQMGVMKEVFFPHACLRYFQHQLGKQKFDGSGEKKSADHNATRIYCET
jgi:hypothetical protein